MSRAEGNAGLPRRLRWTGPLILLAVLLLCAVTARFGGAPGGAVRRAERPVYVADVFGGNVVGQSFRAAYDGLCRIDVLLRPVLGECRATFRLWARGRGEALEGSFPCPAGDSTWATLRFDRVSGSEGVEFYWEVGLTDPTGGAVLSVEATGEDVRPDGTLLVNGQPTSSDAIFLPYYCTVEDVPGRVGAWLDRDRRIVAEWADQDHALLTAERLRVMVPVAALILVAVLILPARQRSAVVFPRLASALGRLWRVRVRPLGLVVTGAGLCLAAALLLLGVQTRAWTGAAARLQPAALLAEGEGGPWVTYDFIANLSAPETVVDVPLYWYVEPGWLALGEDRRPALNAHPPSHVYYTLEVPPEARLHAAAGLDPAVWQPDRGDGVLFIVRTLVDGVEETVYYQEIDPKNRPEDRRWHDFDVDLSAYAGRTITLAFITYPLEDNEWDWAAWGMPVILTPHRPASRPVGSLSSPQALVSTIWTGGVRVDSVR